LRTFGPYEILDDGIVGGMGVVYRARDTRLGRIVALKMIRSGVLASADEVRRFKREAEAAALLNHPNIIKIYDVNQQDGQHFFTMPYAAGGNLAANLASITTNPRAAVTLVGKVARAVQHAHDADILHRDLKPANVLLDERGEPLVADFGLAKFIDANAEMSQSAEQLGTPAYMAPEQAAGRMGRVTNRTDVWALGVLLYELLTGKRPFLGHSKEELSRRIRTLEPARPRSLRRTLDRNLETVVLKCLEKDPARRYDSAAALADDLDRWLRGEPVLARPRSWPVRAWRSVRPHRSGLATAFLMGLLAVTTVVFWQALKTRDNSDPPDPMADALKEMEEDLDAGRPVRMIGDNGPPRWHRYRFGAGNLASEGDGDGGVALSSQEDCYLELCPDPRCESYDFLAQVKHDKGIEGVVGVYFQAEEHNIGAKPDLFVATLSFDELGRDVGHVRYKLVRTRESTPEKAARLSDGKFQAARGTWREIKIEVRPAEVRAFFGGKRLAVPKPVMVAQQIKDGLLDEDWPANRAAPAFSHRGGLGLFVYQASGSFRRVQVVPRP
jgi:serine/threonine-protein kinase